MIHEDDSHKELPPQTEPEPLAPTPGVKVYDRPNRSLPAWALILLALLVLAGLWFVFTTVF